MTAEISLVDTLKANLRQGGIFIAFVAIVVLFWAFNPDTFLSSGNLTNIVLQYLLHPDPSRSACSSSSSWPRSTSPSARSWP